MTPDTEQREAEPTHGQIASKLLAWIEDLETTDAKQGFGALHPGDAYCCLGRACEVLGAQWSETTVVDRWHSVAGQGNAIGLPREFYRPLGVTDEDVIMLGKMNDSYGKTFPEIAAWLRENVLPRYTDKAAVSLS